MKKGIALILLLCIGLTALCGCIRATPEQIVQRINRLDEEITLQDEECVKDIYEDYLQLSEEDQGKVTNFANLKKANDRIIFLTQSKKTMEAAPRAVEEKIKSRLKVPSSMTVTKTQVWPSKTSFMTAYVRMQYTAANALGGLVEETCFAEVRVMGAKSEVRRTHYGDAHESWDDVAWMSTEDVDFSK